MATLYTREEIEKNLTNLLKKRDLVQSKRVALLKKHTAKNTSSSKSQQDSSAMHKLDLEIENWERRLEKLF